MDKLASKGQKKCSFIEYFNNIPGQSSVTTPKDAFRKRIQELTGCGPSAVNNWIYGNFRPNPTAQLLIAKELNIPVDILFPKKDPEPCEK